MSAHVQRRLAWRWAAAAALVWLAPALVFAQDNLIMKRGQRIAPIYEGWIANPDGTFDLIFGYFNLNSEEHRRPSARRRAGRPARTTADFEPGRRTADHGQPDPLEQRRVRRPRTTADRPIHLPSGSRRPREISVSGQLIWKITANGKTEVRVLWSQHPEARLHHRRPDHDDEQRRVRRSRPRTATDCGEPGPTCPRASVSSRHSHAIGARRGRTITVRLQRTGV